MRWPQISNSLTNNLIHVPQLRLLTCPHAPSPCPTTLDYELFTGMDWALRAPNGLRSISMGNFSHVGPARATWGIQFPHAHSHPLQKSIHFTPKKLKTLKVTLRDNFISMSFTQSCNTRFTYIFRSTLSSTL